MKRLLFYIISLGLLASCAKDSNIEDRDKDPNFSNKPTVAELAANQAPEPRLVDIYNEKGAIVYAPKGTILTFPPNTYGNIAGTITLKIYEVMDKKSMIGTGVYTETEDGRMLNSYGMFKVEAYRLGTLVQPQLNVQVTMPVPSGVNPSNAKLFELVESLDTNRMQMIGKWKESSSSWSLDTSSKRAVFSISLLNWCNLDAYIASGSNNRIYVSVPDGFTNKNTAVYFNLDGVRGVTQLNTDAVKKKFYTLELNSGLSGTLVVCSRKDNVYYKKIIKVTFTGAEQTFDITDMEPANQAQMEEILAKM